MSTNEIFAKARAICQEPIPADAKAQLDALRDQLPADRRDDFDWFYEALFVAQPMEGQ